MFDTGDSLINLDQVLTIDKLSFNKLGFNFEDQKRIIHFSSEKTRDEIYHKIKMLKRVGFNDQK